MFRIGVKVLFAGLIMAIIILASPGTPVTDVVLFCISIVAMPVGLFIMYHAGD
jgi:hypothetical protein